ncbi:MAG TPA: DUF6655 family protein [Verrucomicrobiae bacterium]
MLIHKKIFSVATLLVFAAFLLGGCTTTKTTDTARSATEQLLLSTATDHALQSANFSLFANQKVFLDTTYFDSYDSKYAVGTVRDALSRAGAILEDNPTNSDIIIEARSGALATDNSQSLFGIPSLGAPIPLTGIVAIPEIAFYKADKQRSVAKIALLAFARESRKHVYSSGPLDGKSYDKHYRFLFIAWIHTDIPEKNQSEKKAAQYQTWFPQYDAVNLPATNAPMTHLPPASRSATNSLPQTNLPPANPTWTNAPPLTSMDTNTAGMGSQISTNGI